MVEVAELGTAGVRVVSLKGLIRGVSDWWAGFMLLRVCILLLLLAVAVLKGRRCQEDIVYLSKALVDLWLYQIV